jgi:hypothetical protein
MTASKAEIMLIFLPFHEEEGLNQNGNVLPFTMQPLERRLS